MLLGVRVYHDLNICRDIRATERKFYYIINGVKQQCVILWKNNKLYSVSNDGKETEIIYAHFIKRKFIAVNDKKYDSFKVVPGKIIDCDSVSSTDFEIEEAIFYKQKYKLKKYLNSFKKYGIIKSIKRQIYPKQWSKYHEELRSKYNKNHN